MHACRTLFLPLLMALVVADSRAAERAPWAMVDAKVIRAHVEFLADDLLEGRASASRGYDLAAAYVASQFRQAGLAPAIDGESFYQTVPLLEATAVLPGSSAELVLDAGKVVFEYSTDYLPSADFTSASSTLSAPLAFAGYGVTAPELNHDDFASVDVKGRIAVIFSGAPAKFPHHQRAYYSWSTRKWDTLIEHGAVGAILIDSPADAVRTPWERSVSMSWVPQMRWTDEEGKPQNAFPELKLRFRFNHDAATRLFEHAETSFADVLQVADRGDVQGFQLPGLMTLSATTGLRRTQSANVIALLRGSDPQLANEYVVLTAHLDHLGRGSAVNGDSIYNGAHDNALGIGILLEMARALNMSGVKPRRSIVFAAVTAEEKGLLGSDYLAQHMPFTTGRTVANFNIDMPLTFVPTFDFVAFGTQHSTLGATVRSAVAAQGYRLSEDAAPEEVSFIRSDQFSFIRQGVPAIVLRGGYQSRDSSRDAAEMQREFRRNQYHQPADDVSLPFDYATAADLARINLRAALEVANAAARPRWRPHDFFGEKFDNGRSSTTTSGSE